MFKLFINAAICHYVLNAIREITAKRVRYVIKSLKSL